MKPSYISAKMDPNTDEKRAFQNVPADLVALYDQIRSSLGENDMKADILWDEPSTREKPRARLYVVYVPQKARSWQTVISREALMPWLEEQREIPLFLITLSVGKRTFNENAIGTNDLPLLQTHAISLTGHATDEFVLDQHEENTRGMITLLEQLFFS